MQSTRRKTVRSLIYKKRWNMKENKIENWMFSFTEES